MLGTKGSKCSHVVHQGRRESFFRIKDGMTDIHQWREVHKAKLIADQDLLDYICFILEINNEFTAAESLRGEFITEKRQNGADIEVSPQKTELESYK